MSGEFAGCVYIPASAPAFVKSVCFIYVHLAPSIQICLVALSPSGQLSMVEGTSGALLKHKTQNAYTQYMSKIHIQMYFECKALKAQKEF